MFGTANNVSEGKCRTEEQADNLPFFPLTLYGFLIYIFFFFVCVIYSLAFTNRDHNPEVSSHAIDLCKNAWCSDQAEVSNVSCGRAADPEPFLLEESRTGPLGGLKAR